MNTSLVQRHSSGSFTEKLQHLFCQTEMEVVAENQINISDVLFFQCGVDCVSVSVTMTVSEFILIHASSKHS